MPRFGTCTRSTGILARASQDAQEARAPSTTRHHGGPTPHDHDNGIGGGGLGSGGGVAAAAMRASRVPTQARRGGFRDQGQMRKAHRHRPWGLRHRDLRQHKVVGKFVEFLAKARARFAARPRHHRATGRRTAHHGVLSVMRRPSTTSRARVAPPRRSKRLKRISARRGCLVCRWRARSITRRWCA